MHLNNKKYDKYKDSGIEWIGKIPQDWYVKKIKYCCDIFTGNSISDDEKDNYTLNANAIPYIATKDIDADTNTINYDNGLYIPVNNKNFKIAPSNSSLLCVEGGSAGKKIGFINKEVCFVNKLCCFSSKVNFNSKFLYYVLQSDEFLVDFNLKMTGLIGGVSQTAIKNISVTCPKVEQQQAIADYLDKKCGDIDNTIETEKSIIEKIKEYKQSVITEAVTKGLDKSVELKDSGIEWIGKIPQDWKILRIKNIAWLKGRIGWQGLKSDEYQETGAYLITGTDFDNGKINWNTCVHITKERFEEAPEIHIKENDLLITKDGTVGKVALALNCPNEVSLNSGVLLIRNIKDKIKYSSKYLYYILLSTVFWNWFSSNLNGNSTIIHLYQEQFYNFSFCYPTIKEQQQIADYLDKKCFQIDETIKKKEELIEKLTEYKKSLIYECVTGKRRV